MQAKKKSNSNGVFTPYTNLHEQFANAREGAKRIYLSTAKRFGAAIEEIIENEGRKRSTVAVNSNIDARTLRNIVNDPTYMPTMPVVIGLLVGLRRTSAEAHHLYELSRCRRLSRDDERDAVYLSILDTCGQYDIIEINDELYKLGYELLGGKTKK